jgi:hypothetical protein
VTVTQQNATQVATTANKNARYSYKKTNSFKKHWNILAITYKLKHQQQHPTPKKHIKKTAIRKHFPGKIRQASHCETQTPYLDRVGICMEAVP